MIVGVISKFLWTTIITISFLSKVGGTRHNHGLWDTIPSIKHTTHGINYTLLLAVFKSDMYVVC